MNSNSIKIGIVDDDLLFVQLLSSYINNQSSMEVVYTANNGNDYLEVAHETDLDILILDLKMSDGNGIEVLERLQMQDLNLNTVVLSSYYRRSFMGQMLKLGVNAFFPKEIEPEELISVLEAVHSQGHYFSEDQITVMRTQLSTKTPKFHQNKKDSLSSREIEVLELLCQQLTTREIAERLFVSTKTIESHKSNLLLKTGVKNTAGLIIYAVQNNIIDTNDLLLLER